MGFYSETIRKRDENNKRLESSADEAIIRNTDIGRVEKGMDDVQTSLLYILDRMGLHADRIFGVYSIDMLLESMLEPLDMMYEYRESLADFDKRESDYILAFRQDGSSVCIIPNHYGYRYYCPSDAGRGLVTRKFLNSLKGGCYVLTKPLVIKKSVVTTVLSNVLSSLTIYDNMLLMLLSLLVALLGLVIPRVSGYIYEEFLENAAPSYYGFFFALLIFAVASLSRAVIAALKGVFLSGIKIRISFKVQSALMAKVLNLPESFFKSSSSGKISKRISSFGRLSDMVLNIFMDVLLNMLFSVVYLFQMKRLAPGLLNVVVLLLAVRIGVSVVSAVSYSKNQEKLLEVEMENDSLMYSSVKGVEKIKGMGAEKALYAKWAPNYRNILSLTYEQPFFLKYRSELLSSVASFSTLLLIATAIMEEISAADYMTFTSSYALIVTVVSSLTDMMQNIFLIKTLSDNVSPIFAAGSELEKSLEYVRKISGGIRVTDLWFSYPGAGKSCLKGIDVNIEPGEKVAIVGESGCGKSTFLKLLIGMESPDKGIIYYDDKPMNMVNIKSLRRCIGSVFQFSKIFPGTIASNITFSSRGTVTEDMIWKAADQAQIGDYIRGLPLKLETEASESGASGFSGGQRQRILLARALLSKPRVLLLDEATSALDNITQKKVLDSISDLKCTVVMVAHRLSTVVDFDRILMFENGVIAEEGTYEELMEKNGKFAELVRKQTA